MTYLLTFEQHRRKSKTYMEPGGESFKKQLLVQYQWLFPIALFKVFQTSTFANFLNRCSETAKSATITSALNEVIADHNLDLTSYDGYDVESVGRADENHMRVVYDAPPFPFHESLWLSDRVMTFEEILFCPMDEDDNY